jgi:hypothetical protein
VASRLLLVTLVGVALLATACGSPSNSYRKQVNTVQATYRGRLGRLETQLAAAISARKPDPGAQAATASSALVRQLRGEIAALHAPSALATRSTQLVNAYGELVQDLDQLATALRAHAPARANVAIGRYNDARLDVSSAIAALNAG